MRSAASSIVTTPHATVMTRQPPTDTLGSSAHATAVASSEPDVYMRLNNAIMLPRLAAGAYSMNIAPSHGMLPPIPTPLTKRNNMSVHQEGDRAASVPDTPDTSKI